MPCQLPLQDKWGMPSEVPRDFGIVLGQSQVGHKAVMQCHRMYGSSGTLGDTQKHANSRTESLVFL